MSLAVLFDEAFLEHVDASGFHPECPERLVAYVNALRERGLLDTALNVAAREATTEELERVHTSSYVRTTLERIEGRAGNLDGDTFFSPGSKKAALCASGGGIELTRAVRDGAAQLGLALVRPPGHHAEPGRAMGFCIFNNVAVAAGSLLEDGAERILIFDPDVHHGNGTQRAFETDDRVLYTSIHQWPHFPGTGLPDEVGTGKGRGYTVNVPYPSGARDGDYVAAFEDLLLPLARAFRPQALLVSMGFDALASDPLAGMGLTAKAYRYMGSRLKDIADELCDGKMTYFLEGGYDISGSTAALLELIDGSLSGDTTREDCDRRVGERHARVLEVAKEQASEFWKLG